MALAPTSLADLTPIVYAFIGMLATFISIAFLLYKEHKLVSMFLIVFSLFSTQGLLTIITKEYSEPSLVAMQTVIPWICYAVLIYTVVYTLILCLESWGSFQASKKKKREDGEY